MPLLRRRTVRLRLTALYGLLFLMTGAGLLVIAGLVTVRSSSRVAVPPAQMSPFTTPPMLPRPRA